MCGIIGAVGQPDVQNALLEGLKRLEYRGYDSAGIAIVKNGSLVRARAQGKIVNLEEKLKQAPLQGITGIGHTRWATHGIPSEPNAHPHATERVAVVHNGIIENYQALKAQLEKEGIAFESETDSEVVPRMVDWLLRQGLNPEQAVRECLKKLEGAYALVFAFAGHQDMLIAARKGSPLAIGYGEGAMFISSDALALAPFCETMSYLEEGDTAQITRKKAHIFNQAGQAVTRPAVTITASADAADKGNYEHFMLKEIHEQPRVLAQTINAFYDAGAQRFLLPELPFPATELERITMVACGTSYYAALVGRLWFERYAHVAVETDIASEFRYRHPVLPRKGLAMFISQSGETADTLAALRFCKAAGQHTLALVNVAQSSMAREANDMLETRAGREIGVASTKAFTTQLIALACMAAALGRARGALTESAYADVAHAIGQAPDLAEQVLRLEPVIKELAKTMCDTRDMFYIGRGGSFAIAHEGALKMKEISYIHAEAYAAGELKHGPLALISDDVPVLVIAPPDELFEKTASNLQETVARGGRVILLSDRKGIAALSGIIGGALELPPCHPYIAPILYVLPLQLLAYHVALLRGTDVDQPRNLAKSVTVE